MLLPYVECAARGRGAEPPRCAGPAVKRSPTWLIGGARHEGVLTLDELARASGFTAARSR